MAWYIVCIAIGIVIGLVLSRYLPAMIQYKGKIKQKGQGNIVIVENKKKRQKRRLFNRNKV